MNKKILILCLTVMGLIGAVRYIFADAVYTREPGFTCSTESFSGKAPSLSTTITTVNRVLGFTFSDSSAGVTGLYDSSSTGSLTNNFGEAYVAAGGSSTVIFPFPRKLTNGLVVAFSTSTGRTIVYYE